MTQLEAYAMLCHNKMTRFGTMDTKSVDSIPLNNHTSYLYYSLDGCLFVIIYFQNNYTDVIVLHR